MLIYLKYAFFTEVLEFPLLWLLLRKEIDFKNLLIDSALVNVITNITLNVSLAYWGYQYVYLGEIIVFIVESLMYDSLYKNVKYLKWLGISFLANLFSWGMGGLLF